MLKSLLLLLERIFDSKLNFYRVSNILNNSIFRKDCKNTQNTLFLML